MQQFGKQEPGKPEFEARRAFPLRLSSCVRARTITAEGRMVALFCRHL